MTIQAVTTPDGNSDASQDGAVAVSVFHSEAILGVSSSAHLDATNAAKLTASSTLIDTTTGDAQAGTAGAGVAVAVVFGDTTASVQSATVDGSSVTLGASSDRQLTTTANASLGGSTDGGGGDASQSSLSNNDASTSDGSISVAGAVAVTVDTGTTSAYIQSGTIDAGSGAVVVSATPQDVVLTTADGAFTGDTSGGGGTNGVGVAVAINVADRNNLAYITGATDITAGSISITVAPPSPAPSDASSFSAEATSGIGDPSNVGFAGSLALNIIVTNNKAYVDNGATLTLHGSPDVTIEAETNITDTATATPAEGGGGGSATVGIGTSVAFNYGEDTTAAYLDDNASVTGAHGLSLTAEFDPQDGYRGEERRRGKNRDHAGRRHLGCQQ